MTPSVVRLPEDGAVKQVTPGSVPIVGRSKAIEGVVELCVFCWVTGAHMMCWLRGFSVFLGSAGALFRAVFVLRKALG